MSRPRASKGHGYTSPHNQAQRPHRRLPASLSVLVLLVGIVISLGLMGKSDAPVAQAALASAPAVQPSALAGMLVMLSATAEGADAPAADADGSSLVLRITLENRTGQDLTGLRVQAPMPAGAYGTDLMAQKGTPSADGRGVFIVAWEELALRDGEQLGPLTVHIAPVPGMSGARIFREAAVQPAVSWSGPTPGQATPPVLRLNGLWGEQGLRRTVLPTLLTIFTRERPDTPTVSLRMAVRAGSRDEDDTTWGGSHWLEHAHFLGTEQRPNNQALFAPTTIVGGQANASTSWEWTDYWRLVPAENFDVALDVLADQLLNSTFPQEDFERERQVVFQELKRNFDTPSRRANDEFLRLVFQVSPLRRDAAGFVETVANIPVETILNYRAKHYVSGNMAFAAIGNLQHDEAVAAIARAFAALPRGPRGERPRVIEPVQREPRRLEIGEGTRSAEIRLGWPAPGSMEAGGPVVVIIDDLLDLTGRRLEENIRGRGLATVAGSSYFAFSDSDTLMLRATTPVNRADEVIDALLNQIQRLRDGDVTDAEIQAVIHALEGRRLLSRETNQAQAGVANAEVSDTLQSTAEYIARLRQVTAADVQRFAQTYLDTANYTLVIVRS